MERHQVPDGPCRATVMAARQEGKSFGGQFPDRLAGFAAPRKGVDADGRKVAGENIRLLAVPERTDQQAGPARLLGDIAADAFEQVAIALLYPVELIGKLVRVRTACELDPELAGASRDCIGPCTLGCDRG